MAQGMRGKGGKPDPDATLAFGIHEPAVDLPAALPSTLRLYSLKQHLSRFSLTHTSDSAGFSFENFVRNLKGQRNLGLAGERYDILFTRSSAFLSYEGLPGRLKALGCLLNPDWEKRISVATSPEGKMQTFCRLRAAELGALLKASENARSALPPDSFLPEDASGEIDAGEFRARLSRCEIVSSVPSFDPMAFISDIGVVSVFNDEEDSAFLVLGMKTDGMVYTVYVNVLAPPANEQNPLLCRMRYGQDTLAIYRIEVIG